jgi:hypothetical protein
MTKYFTPATQIDGQSSRFNAPILSADDTQATAVAKILAARQDPNASEAASVAQLAQELQQQTVYLEADETLSPAGRRERLVPEVERVRGRIAKVRATIDSLDERAAVIEQSSQDFDTGEDDETLRLVMTGHMTDARDPAKRKALGQRVLAAAAKPFDHLSRAEGNLLKAAFEARDLGVPFVEEPIIEAAWKMRRADDQNSPEVEALRARATTLKSVVGAVEQSLAKFAKTYGLGE